VLKNWCLSTPVAIETLGSWGPDATLLVSELGRRMAEVTGEPRSASFLRQRIDIAIHRSNATAILDTIPPVSAHFLACRDIVYVFYNFFV